MIVRPSSVQAEPNIVPMIDIMLVLLIIFMLFSAIGLPHHPLQIPDPAAAASSGPPIVLAIDEGPTYTLNGRVLEPRLLQHELTTVYAERPDKILFVRGARGVRYQDVVDAFGAARGAGVHATTVLIPPK
jgi:biopolymer transport protein ExbD